MTNRPIVFVHGLGLGSWVFEEQFVPVFKSRGYAVHVLTLPGHDEGTARNARQHVSLDECVQYVRSYIDDKLSGDYALLGLSMGGAICQRLLAAGFDHANLRGLVLLNSVPPANNLIFTLRLCRRLALTRPGVLIDFFSEKANVELVFSQRTTNTVSQTDLAKQLARINSGYSRLEYEIFFHDIISKPFDISVPLLVMGAEDDQLFPPEVAEFTASYYATRAVIVPGLGHLAPLEAHCKPCVDTIDSFLNRIFS